MYVDSRYLVLPTQSPRVVSELVTPLLSSDEEHGLGGGEETELATQRRPVSVACSDPL